MANFIGGGGGSSSQVIAQIVDSAPATLDTLNELAAALNDDANFASNITAQLASKVSSSGATLNSPTLSSPFMLQGSIAYTDLKSMFEVMYLEKVDPPNGTVHIDFGQYSVKYSTIAATGNFTINFRGDASNTLSGIMGDSESITGTFLCTNGSNAYYLTAVTVDGNSVPIKWAGGTAVTSGNANSVDSYAITLVRTSGSYTAFVSRTKFA